MFDNDSQLEKIRSMIKNVKFGMLTTVGAAHDTGSVTFGNAQAMTSRPLTAQQIDAEGNIWFFVSIDADYLPDVAANPDINVSFADVEQELYVSVSGYAVVQRNPQKASELWKPTLQTWFHEGVNDPRLALLKVQIDSAAYWNNTSSKMEQLFESVKAEVMGTPRKTGSVREHGVLYP